MAAAGSSVSDLQKLIKQDIQESQQLQQRIEQLRKDILEGATFIKDNVLGDIESQGKRMSKDLARRIDDFEAKENLNITDREYLRHLNARQVVWDRQVMQMAELRDLMFEARKTMTKTGSKSSVLRTTSSPEPVAVLSVSMTRMQITATASTDDDSQRQDNREGETGEYEDLEPEPDKSTWPLCYQILDIDPITQPRDFDAALKRAYKKLERLHAPKYHPNDRKAPDRWSAVCRAHVVLEDAERKEFYDRHGRIPVELVGFDIAQLKTGDTAAAAAQRRADCREGPYQKP
ncbi:hypothetical protein LTR56_017148 [Elasticomyces elasticus]|nr:hypothetical protein LTR22_025300 [Elasticomyces elasticus]KAK3631003.1 hypothetical protein LTR56_017148 [Elasticomyces elasticus]KAK4910469.1 hypothetical protein LTR49_020825 [Elasticomyces elasticus]KAK5741107.1 hypothetical protein LTS12_024717 [Elasticomyces elasticus]